MLKSHKRYIDSIDLTTVNVARKIMKKEHLKETKQKCHLGTASDEITGGLQLVCAQPTFALSSVLVPQTLCCLVRMEDS